MEYILILQLVFIPISMAKYSADGCEWGWVSYRDHCYYFGAKMTVFTEAVVDCDKRNSTLASVWTSSERDFIIDQLWQPIVDRVEFGWMGLYGTSNNNWAWLDSSQVILNLTGMPQEKKDKCGAVRGSGSYAFLDCLTPVGAYFCKRANPMVYTASKLVNYTIPYDQDSIHTAELFERVWPPRLTGMPNSSYHMATVDVVSETGCAYLCSNVPGCRGFELVCFTHLKCNKYSCTLLSGVP
ncbi:hypothetical protein SNE40_011690 [Patella caerulea]|uniref:C-type lectin domain-containing protein n=1 Tax=Patella caerulea TaxID=87958 RepID=A0AAN8JQJ0_PATCE